MKKEIWLLLPVATLFVLFYLAFEVIPFGPKAFMYWWDMPTAIIMCLGWMASLVLGLANGLD